MSSEIIDLHQWFDSAPGRYLLAWEQACMDDAVADIFGYHALQLGMPRIEGLRTNRMPHQWLALGADAMLSRTEESSDAGSSHAPRAAALWAEPEALPFPNASLDLVVLPHTLELSVDPHMALREVERVLVPEGRVVIAGLNPLSLWGLRQMRVRLCQRWTQEPLYLPDVGEFIGVRRMRDWLRLLSFEVETVRFGCYRPAVRSAEWLERFAWVDPLGAKWWPIFGAAYFLVAVKRVHGMRLLGPAWRSGKARVAATVPVVRRTDPAGPVRRR